MARLLICCLCASATAALLLLSSPALACAAHAAKPDTVAATCTCTGKSDCTCKKGQCKCKKCEAHHKASEAKSPEPLKGARIDPLLPDAVRFDATAGIFI
jgi:hypothetical protein